MCWALGSGFVLARPASESPELFELAEDPALPLALFELLEPELPQAATVTAQAAVRSASRIAVAVLRVIFCMSTRPPAYLFRPCEPKRSDRLSRAASYQSRRVSARAITGR
jgi:hypothetical protein